MFCRADFDVVRARLDTAFLNLVKYLSVRHLSYTIWVIFVQTFLDRVAKLPSIDRQSTSFDAVAPIKADLNL